MLQPREFGTATSLPPPGSILKDGRVIADPLTEAAGYVHTDLDGIDHIRPDVELVVRLANTEDASRLGPHLSRIVGVILQFPKFTDGRAYSQARQLRDRLGYKGEIRAVGQVLPDQLHFMRRCGFDAFVLAKGDPETAWARSQSKFSGVYQPSADGASPMFQRRRAQQAETEALRGLRQAIEIDHKGRIALVSSFGAEAAVLLHLVARIDPGLPVLMIDTGKLFGETLRYRDALVARLGLTDMRVIGPDRGVLAQEDPQGDLWGRDPDRCCALRKVAPLRAALAPFEAWINGRKRYQSQGRAALPAREIADGKVKYNPLASWDARLIQAYIDHHGLPRHPLVADGYRSIGCLPCSDRVAGAEADRAGRWRGRDKDECGIHLPSAPGPRDE